MMKKNKKQLAPLETIEGLIPRNFVEDFQKRANRERLDEIAPWRLKLLKFDKSKLSFGNGDPLRMLAAKERIEDLSYERTSYVSWTPQRRKTGKRG